MGSRRRDRAADLLLAPTVLMVLIGAWEAVVRITAAPPWLVPAPSAIGRVLVRDIGFLLESATVTLGEALAGLVLGGGVGLAAAVAITFAPRMERAILSVALLAKSTPVIAVAPILTIWFGFGHTPKVLVTALLTFFPVLVNALEGFRQLDPAAHDWFRSIDASRWAMFRHGRWPSARPHLFAALKVAGPLSLIGAVVAEWMGAADGLGRAMWLAHSNLRMPELFAAVVVLTVLSLGLYGAIVRWERAAMRWRTDQSSAA